MTDLIKEFWAIVLAIVAFIVWLVRMESKTLANDREIKRLWEQRGEDLRSARDSRQDQKDALVLLENKMDEANSILLEISRDR